VKRINWKECEVTLIVTTEKKNGNGMGNAPPAAERTI